MSDVQQRRHNEQELARTDDIMRLLPRGRHSALDIGARDGHFSRLLKDFFQNVTALDLEVPGFEIPGIDAVAGDVTCLPFARAAFDCVLCLEVLEHVPDVQQACREIARVAKHEMVIGVPFMQDIRAGRTTCSSCGKINPPWGHCNSFSEQSLMNLFSGYGVQSRSFCGSTKARTSAIASYLMASGGNPWGTYEQIEPCMYCGSKLMPPESGDIRKKILSGLAARMDSVQLVFARPRPSWMHVVFSKYAQGEFS